MSVHTRHIVCLYRQVLTLRDSQPLRVRDPWLAWLFSAELASS